MRVYELAKEKGLSSKKVLDLLDKGGYKLASHMSVVSDEIVNYLNKYLSSTSDKKSISVIKGESVVATTTKKAKDSPYLRMDSSLKNRKPSLKNKRYKGYEKNEVTEIFIKSPMPLFEVARKMNKSDGELVFALLKRGMPCNRNHVLPVDIIKSLGVDFGIRVNVLRGDEAIGKFLSSSAKGEARWPIVVVLGHVDHGKTTLLDFLRNKNTVAKEKGGITQHLGAYEVDSKHGKIVFLDTPGHEAFSYLRSRGANVTDIAVLIVAIEDGVKPQTIEAIKHAKKSGVPIIVAINKIDKVPDDRLVESLQSVYRQLAENDVLVEDWGGEVISVSVSAKTGFGIEELLEMIVLQAEMLDLKAEKSTTAKAFVLESNLERGLGPVATVVCLEGTLKRGDYFVCGSSTGKVRLLINSSGDRVNSVGPSSPVKVVGFDSFAEMGGWLTVVSLQDYKKVKSTRKNIVSDFPYAPLSVGFNVENDRCINLIIKTDTRGSKEAIEGSLEKVANKTKKDCARLNIIFSGIGDISENDVDLAYTTGSFILGLHSKIEKKAYALAQEKKVVIKNFDVIYHLIEYLEKELNKTRRVEIKWKKVAQLLVKKVFNIKKIGVIAGCSVQEGTVFRGNKVVCFRDGRKIGEGIINSLQREKKVVKEVRSGYECGFISDGFQDWQESDVVHVFASEKVMPSD